MHPILFKIGSLTVYSFGFIVALAFLLSTMWIAKRARSAGEDPEQYLQAVLWIAITGFIGARLLYVFYFPGLYLENPLRIITDRGGFVWYGGLLTALVTSLIWVKINRISIAKFGDILALPAALGLSIGRIGCFMSGCCYGKPTDMPWGVQFPLHHETHPDFVHPTQLYEAVSLIILLVIMQIVYRRQSTAGLTTCTFFIGYGVIRFLIEYARGDTVYWVDNLFTASQVFSLTGVISGFIAMAFILRRKSTSQSSSELLKA